MDYNKIYEIVEIMSTIRGYGLKTQHLIDLINNYARAYYSEKPNWEKSIKNYALTLFLDSIDKKSKDAIYNLNVNINEECSSLEKENPMWCVDNYGAYKLNKDNDIVAIEDFILRDHETGFWLTEDSSDVAKEFMKNNQWRLQVINDHMTRKEKIINFEYQPKENVPKEFTELLIDYNGFRRVQDLNKSKKR